MSAIMAPVRERNDVLPQKKHSKCDESWKSVNACRCVTTERSRNNSNLAIMIMTANFGRFIKSRIKLFSTVKEGLWKVWPCYIIYIKHHETICQYHSFIRHNRCTWKHVVSPFLQMTRRWHFCALFGFNFRVKFPASAQAPYPSPIRNLPVYNVQKTYTKKCELKKLGWLASSSPCIVTIMSQLSAFMIGTCAR